MRGTHSSHREIILLKLLLWKLRFAEFCPWLTGNRNPSAPKKLSQPFQPSEYTYWDYIDAWTKVLRGQNQNCNLSWFFYYDKNCTTFPVWFFDWWTKFGPTTEILPPSVKEAHEFSGLKPNCQNHGMLIPHYSVISDNLMCPGYCSLITRLLKSVLKRPLFIKSLMAFKVTQDAYLWASSWDLSLFIYFEEMN